MPEPADALTEPTAPEEGGPRDAAAEEQAERTAPGSRRDPKAFIAENWRLLIAGVTLALGITLVILGWYGTAYTNILSEQIPYLISGGLLGLGLIIFAGILAASAAQKRDNDELRHDLTRAIHALEAGGGVSAPAGLGGAPSLNGSSVFVLPGGRSFHEAGCPIVEGKPGVDRIARAEAAASGYAPCKLCDISD